MKLKLEDWNLSFEGENIPCKIPSTLYSVLLENGKIPDPFYRMNEAEVRKLSEKDCSISTSFEVGEEILSQKYLSLVFEGIDTLATVELNSTVIAETNNMHRTWRIPVKGLLQRGTNEICVNLRSPLKMIEKAQKECFLAGNGDSVPGFPHLRKAHYMFGWDWGPTLPDMGLWKPVYLEAGAYLPMMPFRIHQDHLPDGSVMLEVISDKTPADALSTVVRLFSPDHAEAETTMQNGKAVFHIEKPQLWWPNGFGEHPLYTVTVERYDGDCLVDQKIEQIGLRTIGVSQKADRWGKEFCFQINGEKIFAMGANYIPEDSFITRYTRKRTEQLIRQAVKSNFNMLRVWGGGIYPYEDFYDLCDENGILVWQDFMFGCEAIGGSEDFLNNSLAECEEQMKRIRNRACLALLCGNNENETALQNWGEEWYDPKFKVDYLRFFEKELSPLCATVAPDTFYWPSSPSSGGNFQDTDSFEKGDVHSWLVWSQRHPIEEYTEFYPRFCSEFGFESCPGKEAILSFTEPEDRELLSDVMVAHQKHVNGNSKLMEYLLQYYPQPHSFDLLCYTTQLMQAYAMRTAVEHYRRNRGRCMGALYWQLNDCWPVLSWSSIDYNGTPKAVHYAAERFYAPILLSVKRTEGKTVFFVCNETRLPFDGTVRVEWKTNSFELVKAVEFACHVSPYSSQKVGESDDADWIGERKKQIFFAYSLWNREEQKISESTGRYVRPKEYQYENPQLSATVHKKTDGFSIEVFAKKYAVNVFVSVDGAKNVQVDKQFFDLASENPETIEIQFPEHSEWDEKSFAEHLDLISEYNIGIPVDGKLTVQGVPHGISID